MAEVAISRHLFRDILRLIAECVHRPIQRQRELFDCLAFEANRWERCVAMTENATCFGARRGVGPPRHPSTMRGGASRLPKVPDRRRFGLEEGANRRMQVRGTCYDYLFELPSGRSQIEGASGNRHYRINPAF